MVSAVSGGGSSYPAQINASGRRPDAAAMQQKLFKKMDSDGDGSVSSAEFSDFSKNAPKLPDGVKAPSFSDMDTDKSGALSQTELAAGTKQLEEQLHSQFQSMRAAGGGQARPAGPPPSDGGDGMTKDQIDSLAQSTSSSDSTVSSKLTDLSKNFDAADTNQDGKVSIEELLKYEDNKNKTANSSSGSTTENTQSSQQASLQQQLQSLVKSLLGDGQDLAKSGLSVSA